MNSRHGRALFRDYLTAPQCCALRGQALHLDRPLHALRPPVVQVQSCLSEQDPGHQASRNQQNKEDNERPKEKMGRVGVLGGGEQDWNGR